MPTEAFVAGCSFSRCGKHLQICQHARLACKVILQSGGDVMNDFESYEPVRFRPQSLGHAQYQRQLRSCGTKADDPPKPHRSWKLASKACYSASNPRPDSLAMTQSIQDKYNLQQLGSASGQQPQLEPAAASAAASAAAAKEVSSSNPTTALTQQHVRQLQLKLQRIAAVKASAVAVSTWAQQQLDYSSSSNTAAPPTSTTTAAARPSSLTIPRISTNSMLRAAGPASRVAAAAAAAAAGSVGVTSQRLQQLPPSVLQVLSVEADRGLLHMLSVGLLPLRLELTNALSGAPGTPLQMRSAAVHTPVLPGSIAAPSSPTDGNRARRKAGHVSGAKGTATGHHTAAFPPPTPSAMQADDQQLVDSQLQLLLIAGQVVQESPVMFSLLQAAAQQGLWPSTAALLSQLQALCRTFAVPLAVVDGCMLLRLARELPKLGAISADRTPEQQQQQASSTLHQEAGLKQQPNQHQQQQGLSQPSIGLADLLACFVNLEEVAPYLRG